MNDPVFGKLKWELNAWKGYVEVPYFYGFGEEVVNPERDEILRPWGGARSNSEAEAIRRRAADDGVEAEDILLQDRLCIYIDRQPSGANLPTNEQRAAWDQVANSSKSFWDRVMQVILVDYRIQQPIRVRWWKKVFGKLPFYRELPDVESIETLRKSILPALVRIHPIAPSGDIVIAISFLCTWSRESFSLVIRNYNELEVRSGVVAHSPHVAQCRERLLGTNDSFPLATESHFFVQCDSMMMCQNVAVERAKYIRSGTMCERPRSVMLWDFAHGRFPVYFRTLGDLVDPKQVAAILAFHENHEKYCRLILDAVLRRYLENLDKNRLIILHEHADVVLPNVTNVSDLYELMEFRAFHVHLPDNDGEVSIAVELSCAFEPKIELYALWRSGEFIKFGSRNDLKSILFWT